MLQKTMVIELEGKEAELYEEYCSACADLYDAEQRFEESVMALHDAEDAHEEAELALRNYLKENA